MSNASQNRAFRIALKSARQGVGFTPGDLADEVSACGHELSEDTVNAWESGKEAPREWDRPMIDTVEQILGSGGSLVEAIGW